MEITFIALVIALISIIALIALMINCKNLIDLNHDIIAANSWRPIETVPLDPNTPVLLLTTRGVTEAIYCPGEWRDYHEGREYDGPVWSCCDDKWQIEIEQCSEDPREWYHGIAKRWRPVPDSDVNLSR